MTAFKLPQDMALRVATTNKHQLSIWRGRQPPLKAASYGKLMMWSFLLSDAFTFGAFLTSYGLIRWRHPAFIGAAKDFVPSQEYWPIPEMVFDAVPFLRPSLATRFCRDYDLCAHLE